MRTRQSLSLSVLVGMSVVTSIAMPASAATVEPPVNEDRDAAISIVEFHTTKEVKDVIAPPDIVAPPVVADVVVPTSSVKPIKIERAKLTAEAKPKPKPKPKPKVEDALESESNSTDSARTSNATRSDSRSSSSNSASSANSNASTDSLAPVTRENVNSQNSGTGRHVAVPAQSAKASAKAKSTTVKPVAPKSASAIVKHAYAGVGTPYVWGGTSPSKGWDCSGFVQYVYKQAGVSIPRNTSAILGSGKFTRTESPKAGDLVFQRGGSHVGIYVGNGKMIGAQNPSVGTILHDVTRNPVYGYYTLKG